MNIKLTHQFLLTCHGLSELLDNCNKLSTFSSRLVTQSNLFPDRFDPQTYRGDGFELFTEALIKLSPIDKRIGISNYQVVEGQDIGVDGSGFGDDKTPATVQVKFRSKYDTVLTANGDHLSNFVQASLRSAKFGGYGVDPETEKNMLVVTNAMDLHHFTDIEMFGGQVRCLGNKKLRKLVDNNQLFWDSFRSLCNS